VGLQYELHIQKELTSPPLVYCQIGNDGDGSDKKGGSVLNDKMDRIYAKLSGKKGRSNIGIGLHRDRKTGDEEEGILTRKIKPQMFLGTRGLMSSTAAYALGSNKKDDIHKNRREREVMTLGADGALIVLDWEIPLSNSSHTSTIDEDIDIKQPNSITKPIILLLHGMNNDSTFGYIRSMMRTATDRGWIAVCMNFRGQDGDHQIKNNTPRGYNAGFTGDLRGVVQQLEHRLKKKINSNGRRGSEDDYIGGPIFILGYSLGANVVTKYLGEESLHGTLPTCIGGGAAMGNPLHIHSGTIRFPWNIILGAGVKRSVLQNFHAIKSHNDPGFQHAMKKAMLAPTIGKLDDAAAPYLARNDPYPPYTHRIGFKDGEEYWCGVQDETFEHLLACPHPDMNTERQDSIHRLQEDFKKLKLPPAFSLAFIRALKVTLYNSPIPTSNIPSITAAYAAQERIGYYNMAVGLLANEWTEVLAIMNVEQPQSRMEDVLSSLWDNMCEQMWKTRCNIKHSPNNKATPHELQQLQDKLLWYLRHREEVLDYRHRFLAQYNPEDVSRWSRATRRAKLESLNNASQYYRTECTQRAQGQTTIFNWLNQFTRLRSGRMVNTGVNNLSPMADENIISSDDSEYEWHSSDHSMSSTFN